MRHKRAPHKSCVANMKEMKDSAFLIRVRFPILDYCQFLHFVKMYIPPFKNCIFARWGQHDNKYVKEIGSILMYSSDY